MQTLTLRPQAPPVGGTAPPTDRRALARAAGLLYLVIVVFGLFAEVGVRSQLVESGDPTATAANILDAEWLFRVGFAADLIVFLADVALAVVLYQLLRPLSETLAMLAAAFRLTQTAIIGMNLLAMFNGLRVLDDAEYLGTLGPDGVEALAMLSIESHKYGYILGLTFFGVATVIIGALAIRSPRMPTAMGVVLVLAGVGYVVDAGMFFLIGGYDGSLSPLVLAPAVISEAWFALWLLTRAGRALSADRSAA